MRRSLSTPARTSVGSRLPLETQAALIEVAQSLGPDDPIGLEARNRVVLANLGLVYLNVSRLGRRADDEDDLVQRGTLALFSAVRDYDATRGVMFSTYAYCRVRFALMDCGGDRPITYEGPTITDPRLDAEVEEEPFGGPLWLVREAIDGWSSGDARHRRLAMIVRHRLGLDDAKFMTQTELGEMFGVSKERVRQLEAKAFEKLRKSLGVCEAINGPKSD